MADKRINALANTASSTASDDFIAVDGTTNGTRKLNAFSPTFGGNATVTGTLTVNGGVTTINGNASGTTSYARLQNNGSSISLWGSRAAIDGGTATDVGLFVYGANELSFWTNSTRSAWISSGGVFNTVAGAAVGGTLSVASTTASTTTSTGALVVGNGSSGGLGVGGDIHASNVSSFSSSAVRAKLDSSGQVSWGVIANQGILTWDAGKARIGGQGTNDVYLVTNSTADRVKVAYSDGAVSVLSTTASTSTSSGALVVGNGTSGGLGVGGAIVTGGIVRCGGANGLSLGSDTGNIRIDSAGPAGVEFRGLSAADTISGFTMREMALIDGTSAPSTRAGYATIYVDSADGDLKVKFGDGTVKTIATDS